MPDETFDPSVIETGVDAETADAEVEVAPSDAPELPVEGKDNVEVVTYDTRLGEADDDAPISFEGLPSHTE